MNEKTADKTSLEIKRFVNALPGPAFTTRGLLDRLNGFYCRAFLRNALAV